MYKIEFEINGKTITKQAKNEKEVRRLVYLYKIGIQKDLEQTINDILSTKSAETVKKLLKNKTENDVNL